MNQLTIRRRIALTEGQLKAINQAAHVLAQQSFGRIRDEMLRKARAMLDEGHSSDEVSEAIRSWIVFDAWAERRAEGGAL